MKKLISFFAVLLMVHSAFGHGEDKPGPNGGHVQMPGAFHTELVVAGPTSVKIFLTDINYKDPKVQDSSVKLTHKGPKVSEANCAAKDDHFLCEFPKSIDWNQKGKLELESSRANQKGIMVTYKLPLEKH